MKKYSISNLDANKSNVNKEEVQETSREKRRSPSFGVLKGVKIQSVFKYMCVAAIVIAASCFVISCSQDDDATGLETGMEYIDIPEIESNELWFTDNELNKKYYEALRRFDSHIELDNGYIKVEIISGEKIGISEQLFKRFSDGSMQINQDVKGGKYQLSKRDGYIVIVNDIINQGHIRLKNGSHENNGWTPVNMNQSPQNLGMALLGAMRQYWQNRHSTETINELINMSTGNFSRSNYMRSGTFTYGGYTYTWTVNGACQANNMPDDCIWSNISSDYKRYYGDNGQYGGILRLDMCCNGGHIFSIQSPQSGSYGPLYHYTHDK
jgi:hypothetical protein